MENKTYTGHVLLVMAPTGSGKGTLERYVLAKFPEIKFAVSCTTRRPRPNEKAGVDYHYISSEIFHEKIVEGKFLEWAEFSGNLYGTLKAELLDSLESGQLVINEIELQGIEQIKKIIPAQNLTIVYIDAGDWSAMERRALGRAPLTEDEVAMRQARYEHEVAAKPFADIVIDNCDGRLEEAKKEFTSVVENILHNIATT